MKLFLEAINGTACIVVVIAIQVVSLVLDIKQAQENLLNTVFCGGVVLLGAGVGEQFIKNQER